MNILRFRPPWPLVLAAAGALVSGPWRSETALGLTPQSREVREAVSSAVRFLESPAADDGRMGAKALVGLAILKSGAKKDHPRIQEAVAAVRELVQPNSNPANLPFERLYTPAIATIFLLELDPVTYAGEISALLKYLEHVKKSNGAWGYLAGHEHAKTGDTSMTQYGVLALWEAFNAGFPVSRETIEGALAWLLKTQDPNGGFGYQGKISGTFSPIPQEEVSPSLSAAGLGSVYASADLLGLSPNAAGHDLPQALEPLDERGRSERVTRRLVVEAQSRGNHWMSEHYTLKSGEWTLYYLYAWERYHSFRDAAEGNEEAAPKWYSDGAEFLIESQSPDGSWEAGHRLAGAAVNTSFGVLFLVRSMKKSIERARNYGAGTLVGGRGLPKDTDSVIVREGSVMSLPEVQAVERVLSAVNESGDSEQFETIGALEAMSTKDAVPLIDKHAEKLRELAGEGSPEARLAAVAALAKRRNMDDVPVLIYALTDPDPRVVLKARDGLRRISCRFHGFGLPDKFTDPELRAAIARWKQWYRAVRPDAEFVE